MKKEYVLVVCAALAVGNAVGQLKGFDYKFYGQVRADLFYNSRSNSETVDGLFYMYPKDKSLDANGDDLNAKPDGNFYAMYTRLGVDLTGPDLGENIKTSAKVELDFRGGSTNYYMVRLRQAYFNLGFGRSSLLVGQTLHPFYGEVAPEILNLNMGAPFQPFSRAPQIRYRYYNRGFQLTATALWQSQYTSVGPKTNNPGDISSQKSNIYLKNSCVPEFALNLDYKNSRWIAGAGIDATSLVPRTQSEFNGAVYKVSERITSFSAEAHAKYVGNNWLVAAKTMLGSNFTQASGVGGYGIKSIDKNTGEQTYAPIRVSSTWFNVAYGKKWRPGVFVGYLKNLGADNSVDGVIGTGVTDGIDHLVNASVELTYNLPHWKFGAEYLVSNAAYGSLTEKARVENTHSVTNHRLVLTALFQF